MDASFQGSNTYGEKLGLLRRPIFDDSGRVQPSVFLNGSRGNFCLQEQATRNRPIEPRDAAWSAGVGHFIRAHSSTLEVWRWDKTDPQSYPRQQVEENLEKFYLYLRESEPNSDQSIVS